MCYCVGNLGGYQVEGMATPVVEKAGACMLMVRGVLYRGKYINKYCVPLAPKW